MIVLLTIGIFLGFYIFATKNTPRIKSFLLGIAAGVFVFFLFFVRNTLYSFVLLPEKTLLFNIVVEETTKIVALLFILRSKPPSSYWSAYGIGWGFASVEHLVLVISQGNISLARMLFASTLHIITLFCFLFVLHIRKKRNGWQLLRAIFAWSSSILIHYTYNWTLQKLLWV